MRLRLNISSKISLAALLLLLVFLTNLRYQQWRNQKAVENEKQRLQDEISSLSQKNRDLSDSLSYLGSSDFKDRMARQQLNLKRDGEVVFGFIDAQTPAGGVQAGSKTPNYEKWVQYFFGTGEKSPEVLPGGQ